MSENMDGRGTASSAAAAGDEHVHDHGHHDESHGEHSHAGHEHDEGPVKKSWARVIAGGVMMAVGAALQYTVGLDLWAAFAIYFAAYLVLGLDVIVAAGLNIIHGKVFDENFLMTIATLGTFALGIWQRSGDFAEACAVMLFYQVGELLSDAAVDKSRDSITRLMDIRPDYANLLTDKGVERVEPGDVEVGQIIVIRPGEKVPLDSVVTKGTSTMNTAALTGESVPRDVLPGTQILAGCVNGEGLLEAKVESDYTQSSAARILDIMENASASQAVPEKFITKFARYYTPIVCAAALIVAIVPPLVTGDWDTWIYRALLFLVVSCPCALVVSVPLTYFSGIGAASKSGILVKGANDLETLAELTEVVFDKTGTLTKGTFTVTGVSPAEGVSREVLLKTAAIAEQNSSHPIAKSILAAYTAGDLPEATDVKDIAGYGIVAEVGKRRIAAGNAKLMKQEDISFSEEEGVGTILYVAEDGQFLGSILISDTVKPDAASVISRLHSMGINTAMLTGDNCSIGQKVGDELGVGTSYCQLLPQDKVELLEKIEKSNRATAFVGDGINDAPVLAISDVGIAMGGVGSDAAIEAADVVLMHDKLTEIPAAVGISRKTRAIVLQNIIFAIAVKVIVMILGVMGYANMWLAVFADVGVTLIAIVNSLRALFYKESGHTE